MIEAILILSALAACVIVVVVAIIGGLIAAMRPRPKRFPYGPICTYCRHHLDLRDRKTLRSYYNGKCPSCGHDLMELP